MKTERDIRDYIESWISEKPEESHYPLNRMRLVTLAQVVEDEELLSRVRAWFDKAGGA